MPQHRLQSRPAILTTRSDNQFCSSCLYKQRYSNDRWLAPSPFSPVDQIPWLPVSNLLLDCSTLVLHSQDRYRPHRLIVRQKGHTLAICPLAGIKPMIELDGINKNCFFMAGPFQSARLCRYTAAIENTKKLIPPLTSRRTRQINPRVNLFSGRLVTPRVEYYFRWLSSSRR